ncbi:DeoR/GlpR transcriptional regulator [Rhodovastum atsumiense]|uniref:DeoR/GlpR transcriptional regulator n=2 Tax=Rhodovastum atsumiense TaxID=504468 RepID=A0A5M6IV25_9PROT|nr:DeoR/GlpR transcriptional regulator [Rhodovastum atsumiense]
MSIYKHDLGLNVSLRTNLPEKGPATLIRDSDVGQACAMRYKIRPALAGQARESKERSPMLTDKLRYRDAPQRRAAILDHLRVTGFVTVSEVAERLGVSEMTVRRDARRLHEEGEAISLRGALRLPAAPGAEEETDDEYRRRERVANAAKAAIGKAAAAEIRSGDVVAIDAGTTACQVAAALPADFAGTVVTHSVPVLNLLLERPAATAIALGGDLYRPSRALVGSATVEAVRRLKVRTFYLGAAAADLSGIYAAADVESLVKQTLMSIADRVVLVLDHLKFEATAPVRLCSWDALEMVVSDQPPPPPIAGLLQQRQIRLLVSPAGVAAAS